jgi:hypothetical protein
MEVRRSPWSPLATAAVWNGADRETRTELMRESDSTLDLYAHQRTELPQ